MKTIKYILAVLITVSFFSCEKESLDIRYKEEGSDYNIPINPKDTAGLVVPEGYAMVVMGESQTNTRAVSSSDRISHLQYLIYELTGSNEYRLYKKEVVFESFGIKNWPCDAQIEILPKGKEWKVVFLGNMSKNIFGNSQTEDVLTGTEVGTSLYTDARIILPQVEFTNQTMFHFAESNFNTNTETVEVPITLKRIVSRHDIYQEGPASMDEYYAQVLKDKLYADIFTASNSVFRYQLRDCILNEVIWPITYMGLQAIENPDHYKGNYKSVKWYLDTPSMYAQVYLDGWKEIVTDKQGFGFLKLNDYPNNYYLNLAEYLYEVFVEGSDFTIIETVLSQICTENNEGFITNAQNKISNFFKANYKTGTLSPWSGNAIIDRTAVPSIIDFSFNVIQSDNAGLKYYNGNTRSNGRRYFSVVTLPDANADSKLTFNNISITDYTNSGGGIEQLPLVDKKTEISANPLNGGPFLQNMKYDCVLKLTSATLKDRTSWTPYENNWQEVKLSYYNILSSLSLEDDGKGTITIGSGSFQKTLCTSQSYNNAYFAGVSAELLVPLTKVLCSIHNIMIGGGVTPENARTLRFPFKLKAPIFQDNIEVTTAWDEAIANSEP